MKEKKKIQLPNTKPGNTIEITARLCSDNIQKNITLKSRYVVEEISKLKDGAIVLIVKHPRRAKSTLRINADRFVWRVVSVETLKAEARRNIAIGKINETKQIIQDKFTEDEQKQILFVPSAILEIVAYLAEGLTEMCRGDKKAGVEPLSEFKKLSRELNTELENFRRERDKSLNKFSGKLTEIMYDFMNNEGGDIITSLMLNIQNEFYKINSKDSDRLMRVKVYSVAGWLMVEMLIKQENNIDQIITKAFGGCAPHKISPCILNMSKVMKEYSDISVSRFSTNNYVKICFNRLLNAIKAIPFNFNGYPEY